ncbi:protein serine/threonine kinase [Thecamonas trahens ATCC 50062]|uniref:Protein serine/threonine kinase n=1 Tax=Thecamonas trahens ATCC 50062 TaxID=461836 RepID=A0A0L0D5T5_THETB|nr:protein serine/threonine kinase [Thecamonas trahens ATCC 50062]KNC47451.1 protein serine/threonine kinase [Thecamonas trahens ATCC 50062]|eukprot:XP_013759387.1 protein serine/threonine kinase [Thecamonas trahens ATCC 50062]
MALSSFVSVDFGSRSGTDSEDSAGNGSHSSSSASSSSSSSSSWHSSAYPYSSKPPADVSCMAYSDTTASSLTASISLTNSIPLGMPVIVDDGLALSSPGMFVPLTDLALHSDSDSDWETHLAPVASRVIRSAPHLMSPRSSVDDESSLAGSGDSMHGTPAIRWDHFDSVAEIARGAHGVVYRGKLCGSEYAIKLADNRSSHNASDLLSEVRVLNAVRHRFVLSIVGLCIKDDDAVPRLGMVTEYANSGTLQSYICAVRAGSSPAAPRTELLWLSQIASGLAQIHASALVHLDIKPDNIFLVAAEHAIEVRIGDFGSAVDLVAALPQLGMASELASPGYVSASLSYCAPEVFMDLSSLTPAADVFSLAIVGFELVSKATGLEYRARRENIYVMPDWSLIDAVKLPCSQAVASLLRACAATEPASRPSALSAASSISDIYNDSLSSIIAELAPSTSDAVWALRPQPHAPVPLAAFEAATRMADLGGLAAAAASALASSVFVGEDFTPRAVVAIAAGTDAAVASPPPPSLATSVRALARIVATSEAPTPHLVYAHTVAESRGPRPLPVALLDHVMATLSPEDTSALALDVAPFLISAFTCARPGETLAGLFHTVATHLEPESASALVSALDDSITTAKYGADVDGLASLLRLVVQDFGDEVEDSIRVATPPPPTSVHHLARPLRFFARALRHLLLESSDDLVAELAGVVGSRDDLAELISSVALAVAIELGPQLVALASTTPTAREALPLSWRRHLHARFASDLPEPAEPTCHLHLAASAHAAAFRATASRLKPAAGDGNLEAVVAALVAALVDTPLPSLGGCGMPPVDVGVSALQHAAPLVVEIAAVAKASLASPPAPVLDAHMYALEMAWLDSVVPSSLAHSTLLGQLAATEPNPSALDNVLAAADIFAAGQAPVRALSLYLEAAAFLRSTPARESLLDSRPGIEAALNMQVVTLARVVTSHSWLRCESFTPFAAAALPVARWRAALAHARGNAVAGVLRAAVFDDADTDADADADETLHLRNFEAKPLATALHNFHIAVVAIFGDIVRASLRALGPPPTHFALFSLGSLAHGVPALFDTLKFACVVDADELGTAEYFEVFIKYLELKVAQLGEVATTFSDRPGFSLDTQGMIPFGSASPISLFGTPETLAAAMTAAGEQLSVGLAELITSPSLLFSSTVSSGEQLLARYYAALDARLSEMVVDDSGGSLVSLASKLGLKMVVEAATSARLAPLLPHNPDFSVTTHLALVPRLVFVGMSTYTARHAPGDLVRRAAMLTDEHIIAREAVNLALFQMHSAAALRLLIQASSRSAQDAFPRSGLVAVAGKTLQLSPVATRLFYMSAQPLVATFQAGHAGPLPCGRSVGLLFDAGFTRALGADILALAGALALLPDADRADILPTDPNMAATLNSLLMLTSHAHIETAVVDAGADERADLKASLACVERNAGSRWHEVATLAATVAQRVVDVEEAGDRLPSVWSVQGVGPLCAPACGWRGASHVPLRPVSLDELCDLHWGRVASERVLASVLFGARFPRPVLLASCGAQLELMLLMKESYDATERVVLSCLLEAAPDGPSLLFDGRRDMYSFDAWAATVSDTAAVDEEVLNAVLHSCAYVARSMGDDGGGLLRSSTNFLGAYIDAAIELNDSYVSLGLSDNSLAERYPMLRLEFSQRGLERLSTTLLALREAVHSPHPTLRSLVEAFRKVMDGVAGSVPNSDPVREACRLVPVDPMAVARGDTPAANVDRLLHPAQVLKILNNLSQLPADVDEQEVLDACVARVVRAPIPRHAGLFVLNLDGLAALDDTALCSIICASPGLAVVSAANCPALRDVDAILAATAESAIVAMALSHSKASQASCWTYTGSSSRSDWGSRLALVAIDDETVVDRIGFRDACSLTDMALALANTWVPVHARSRADGLAASETTFSTYLISDDDGGAWLWLDAHLSELIYGGSRRRSIQVAVQRAARLASTTQVAERHVAWSSVPGSLDWKRVQDCATSPYVLGSQPEWTGLARGYVELTHELLQPKSATTIPLFHIGRSAGVASTNAQHELNRARTEIMDALAVLDALRSDSCSVDTAVHETQLLSSLSSARETLESACVAFKLPMLGLAAKVVYNQGVNNSVTGEYGAETEAILCELCLLLDTIAGALQGTGQ